MADLQATIEELWERRDHLGPHDGDARAAVEEVIGLLDRGEAQVAEVGADGEVVVHAWLKQAILLLFRLNEIETVEVGPFEHADKLPRSRLRRRRCAWCPARRRAGGVPRPGVILMPATSTSGPEWGPARWSTVGDGGVCAQIGSNVHLSGGVGIGGVLEPPQAAPVMIGDDVMVGPIDDRRGARVGDGVLIGAGVILAASIPVIDAETGEELSRSMVPPWCVAVQATRPGRSPAGSSACRACW